MFIHHLITSLEENQSPNLKVVLLDPTCSENTTLEINTITHVDFKEENIGTEIVPNLQTTWTFLHRMQDGTSSRLDFIVSQQSWIGLLLLSSASMQVKSSFIINPGSNILDKINDTFNSIEESVQTYTSKIPVHTPPIQSH